ncbi:MULTISPECIES: PEP-CTERM sorting domain-containing protein [unclassified Lentimonas]|uniref:PEP-CTERM sorting domain-containing protein n=1 Tax=unclassified Lentimonas TaxID=2630993 RepID=UPI00132A9DD8|nr:MULTISPECIES: PEP-CTERM sorting domain-containing protein [unclassified Lentimonas]CAA6676367.1 Unannotated [Lentimonas sp. CC4]CAA6685205.1 Unannotated [Lentimonas sp. CC6]CAA7075069.1 Unannotated [Lentimonas sp. CC4]CAA7169626.1 Unannotated [Lentimonas sp. CC21]CAA7182094.1 Unannotated [Lentimonas sp. CC8]
MKSILYTIGLVIMTHSISSTAQAAINFPTTDVVINPNGYIGGHFGNVVNYNEWVGSATAEAEMNNGVLETASTSPTFRGAAMVFDSSYFNVPGDYELTFDVTYHSSGPENTGNVNIWSGSGYNTTDSALIVDTQSGTLRTTGSAVSTELGSLLVQSTGNNQSIAFTYDGTSDVAFFFGATSGSAGHPEVNYANISVQAVPEPSTYALVLGLTSVFFVARRRKRI